MADIPEIPKDANLTIPHTVTCNEDLTGATITWAMLPIDSDFSGNLDELITDSAVLIKDNIVGEGGHGGVEITDGPNKEFSVTIDDADSEELTPAYYWLLVRILTADDDMLAPRAQKVRLVV